MLQHMKKRRKWIYKTYFELLPCQASRIESRKKERQSKEKEKQDQLRAQLKSSKPPLGTFQLRVISHYIIIFRYFPYKRKV